MIKVRATDMYMKNSISDNELKRIPKKGEEFEVSEDRLDVLLGNNKWKKTFVEVIEEDKPIERKKTYNVEHKAMLREDKDNHYVKKAIISK